MSTSDSEYKEYQESTTITFEWTVKGLKQLFDSRWVQTVSGDEGLSHMNQGYEIPSIAKEKRKAKLLNLANLEAGECHFIL